MITLYKARLINFVFVVMFILFSILLFSLYQTFRNFDILKCTDAIEYVVQAQGNNILISSRSFEADAKIDITIHRTLYEESRPKNRLTIEGGAVDEEGTFVLIKSIVLPRHIRGRWCSGMEMEWEPFMSMRRHYTVFDDICFEVQQ
jgi:uncharacterized membrane protein